MTKYSHNKSCLQETKRKTKTLHKTLLSKIKIHLKLSSKSVGQGRGGMEGTVRPSQLRAGSPPKKKITKEKISPRERQNIPTRDMAKTKTLHKTQFSKIKVHLKLKHKSVGQGRGGMEGTMRPSQLRAGSHPKKNGKRNTIKSLHLL